METAFLILGVWWLVGYAGFVFWWTREHDLEVGDALFGVVTGVMGPIAFVLGFSIHGKSNRIVLIKRRGRE